MNDMSPQREELKQWFLEHGQELIPQVGGALVPSGGEVGQVLAKTEDGVEWVDADAGPAGPAGPAGAAGAAGATGPAGTGLDLVVTPVSIGLTVVGSAVRLSTTKNVLFTIWASVTIPSGNAGTPAVTAKIGSTSNPNTIVDRIGGAHNDPDGGITIYGNMCIFVPKTWYIKLEETGSPSWSYNNPMTYEIS